MSASAAEDAAQSETAAWVAKHVERYAKVQGHFKLFADVLQQVLGGAAKKLAPLAIIQARPKSIPSFAEKIIRKRHLYKDPLADMTDLYGGRVIAHTAEQVHAVSKFIEKHFTIDWDNSDDVTLRLRPAEFGYRSVHYIVSFRPGEFPSKDVGVEIPAMLLGCLPRDMFPEDDPPHPYKAEIQVRTMLEHAWADISHDMAYKAGFKVPAKIQRDFAAVAAVLEGTDREFSRLHENLHVYAAEQGKYLTPKQIATELEQLDLVLVYDPGNLELATRIAVLAMEVGDWQKAVAVLTKFPLPACQPELWPETVELLTGATASSCGREGWQKAVDTLLKSPVADHQPALKTLGIALGKLRGSRGDLEGFQAGRRLLQAATQPPYQDPEGLCALADTWRAEDEDQARKFSRQAFELDPTHPRCLANYLEFEIAWQRNNAIISLIAPTIAEACRRCRSQIEGEVNLPWAYLHLAKFHLLLGQPYASLTAMAKAIERCPAPFMLEAALDSLKRIAVIAEKLPGHEWLRKLVLLGQAVKYPKELPIAISKVRELATPVKADKPDAPEHAPIRGPVVIVAGGCDKSVEGQMQSYRELLLEAFKDFTGAILSGGTTQGIAGLVGDVRQHYGPRIHTIGYIPSFVPTDGTAKVDEDRNRYDEIRRTNGAGFSPLEPLQNWIDLLAAGIEPKDVKVLGINGGTIAALEYRIAAALGARVVLLEKSGRETAKAFSDPDWEGSPNLIGMPADAMTIRAFVGYGKPKLSPEQCDTIAQGIHEAFRRNKTQPSVDPSMANWGDLRGDFKNSNRDQANHIFEKLREIGCSVQPLEGSAAEPFAFTPDEIERLAEMEHGRWNAERLLESWRLGSPKDVARKISPCLVSWADLPDDVKEWDRAAVKEIPALLAKVGLRIQRGVT